VKGGGNRQGRELKLGVKVAILAIRKIKLEVSGVLGKGSLVELIAGGRKLD
jgi:hypothetical protein